MGLFNIAFYEEGDIGVLTDSSKKNKQVLS
jgi:hypothetical protein